MKRIRFCKNCMRLLTRRDDNGILQILSDRDFDVVCSQACVIQDDKKNKMEISYPVDW